MDVLHSADGCHGGGAREEEEEEQRDRKCTMSRRGIKENLRGKCADERAMTVHYGSGESELVIRATSAAARQRRGANKAVWQRRRTLHRFPCSKERQGQH